MEGFKLDINNVKQLIYNSEIISFDIFDTLLLRPYARPVDLFKHLEYINRAENFYEERILAEKNARKKYHNQEDITYDQIYEFIPDKFKFLKLEELSLEKQVLTPNIQMKEIFEYARSLNKKIIIVSDMYLPTKELSDILISKGFSGFDKIYVSGDLGKTKYRGSLYQTIIDEYRISPDKILHFGDNNKSDYEIPINIGIKAVLCKRVLDELFIENPRAKIFHDKFKESLAGSIIMGLIAIALRNNNLDKISNYWEYFGFSYGGPVCFSYMMWVLKNAKKHAIEKLLFIARDGYILEKVFNLINPTNIESEYVYAPRTLCLSTTLDYNRYIKAKNVGLDSLKSLVGIYNEANHECVVIDDIFNALNFINEHKDFYQSLANINKEKFKCYLNKFNLKDKKLALVDSVTGYFTAQNLIETILGKSILSFYWLANLNVFKDAEIFYEFLSFDKTHSCRIKDWMVVEFLMGSPEPPVKALNNCEPQYQILVAPEEKYRMSIYPYIANGILSFTQLVKEIFGDLDLYMDNETVTEWINLFCLVPTNFEKEIFASGLFSLDFSHSKFRKFPRMWFEISKPKIKESLNKISKIERVFSIRNEDRHKVIRVCGLKIKLKRAVKV